MSAYECAQHFALSKAEALPFLSPALFSLKAVSDQVCILTDFRARARVCV